MNDNTKYSKRLVVESIVAVLLFICLCTTSFALVWSSVSVDNNFFHTGTIKINLNDGEPIIKEYEFLFEPGMTVKKDFFVENESTWDVYYRLYFDHVKGDLANVLQITIKDGEKTICRGTAAELDRKKVSAAEDVLRMNERRDLAIYFHFPSESGNNTQNLTLSFALCADAVQTKNNPQKLFD